MYLRHVAVRECHFVNVINEASSVCEGCFIELLPLVHGGDHCGERLVQRSLLFLTT